MSHKNKKVILAVCFLACSAFVGASAPASRVAALANQAEEKPAARPETKSTETLWPFARAASAGGVPSARKLFGVYDETTPTETPTVTPTGAPTPVIPPCNGTLIDFEGVDAIILESGTLAEIGDGSGAQVNFIAQPGSGTESFVSNVSEVANFTVAPTTFTSGGVFATAGDADLVSAGVLFPELVCEVSFGFAVEFFEPVDEAITVFGGNAEFNASADPGDFNRASGFVRFSDDSGEFGALSVAPLVATGDVRGVILDNVCFTPCGP